MSESEDNAKSIARILRILANNIEKNPQLLKDSGIERITVVSERRSKQRLVEFNLFEIISEVGEEGLRERLTPLELDTLRKIVRRYGFDPSKLAEKWKDRERLIDLIIERVTARSDKGKAFKDYTTSKPAEN